MRQRSRQAGRNLGRKSTSVTMTTASRTIQAVLATAPVNSSSLSSTHQTSDSNASSHDEQPAHWAELPRGEQLLNRIVTQWQFGDWTKLAAFDPNDFAHHPHRAKLALFAAAGHQQLGHHDDTRRLVRLAQEWGCDRKLIGRVLLSGVYNTLGRAKALAGSQNRTRPALGIEMVDNASGQDLSPLMPAWIQWSFNAPDPSHPLSLTPKVLAQATDAEADQAILEAAQAAWMIGDWQALTTYDKADLVRHPARARMAMLIAAGYQQVGDMKAVDRCIHLAVAWGEDHQLIKAILTSGIFNLLGRACAAGLRFAAAHANFRQCFRFMHAQSYIDNNYLKLRIEHQMAMIPGLEVAETVAAILSASPESTQDIAEPQSSQDTQIDT